MAVGGCAAAALKMPTAMAVAYAEPASATTPCTAAPSHVVAHHRMVRATHSCDRASAPGAQAEMVVLLINVSRAVAHLACVAAGACTPEGGAHDDAQDERAGQPASEGAVLLWNMPAALNHESSVAKIHEAHQHSAASGTDCPTKHIKACEYKLAV